MNIKIKPKGNGIEKLLKNKNFRNNQNYVIGLREKDRIHELYNTRGMSRVNVFIVLILFGVVMGFSLSIEFGNFLLAGILFLIGIFLLQLLISGKRSKYQEVYRKDFKNINMDILYKNKKEFNLFKSSYIIFNNNEILNGVGLEITESGHKIIY